MPPALAKRRTWFRFRRKAAPPGGGGNAVGGGGPFWADAYRSRRAPSSSEMVEAWKSCLFFLSGFNAKAVGAVPLRLYLTTGPGQAKAKSYLGARPVSRQRKAFLRSRPYLVKELAGAEEVEEVTGDHPILAALRDVNPFLDHVQLLSLTVTSLDVIGHAYWEPVGRMVGGRSVPEELWLLPAQVVWPVPDGTSLVPKGYQYFSRFYGTDELIRFRNPALRNPYMDGASGARAAIEYARLEDEFVSVQDCLWSNGPRPGTVLSPKDPTVSIGDAERARVRQQFNAVGARGRMGGLVITDGAVDVKTLNYPQVDPGAQALGEYNLERMANALDIPPPFYSKETNLANMQAAREWHASNAVEPRCKAIASTLTRFFRALDGDGSRGWDRLFFAFDACVEEDKKAAAEQHKAYLDMGVITRDAVAMELGYEPLPDGTGGEVTVPNSLTTLKAVIEAASRPPPEPVPGALAAEVPGLEHADEEEVDEGDQPPPAKALTAGGEHRRHFRWRSDQGPA